MNIKSSKLCWESKAAIICIVALLIAGLFQDPYSYLSQTVIILLIAFSVGFSISSIRHKGLFNKIIGIAILLILTCLLLSAPLINLMRFFRTGNVNYLNPWK